MRVLFTSTAGLGHLLPLLPLAAAARDAGEDVVVASPAEHTDRVEALGLTHAAIGAPTAADRAAVRERHLGDFVAAGNEVFGSLNPRSALPIIERLVGELRPDVVVSETAEFAGGLVAERASLPWIRVHPGQALSAWEELVAPTLDELRSERGLAADPDARWLLEQPQLSAFPAGFDDPGAREQLITRYRPPGLPRPGNVRDLLYVTFGTEIAGQPTFGDLARAATAAAVGRGLEVVLSIAHADPEALGDLGPGVRVERWVDQADVLPRAAAVVCHGGSGTVLGALAAAAPVVAIPFFADQPYNADRLVQTGGGARVDPGPDLHPRIGTALDAVLAAPRPTALAAQIAALPDIGMAVAAIRAAAAGAGPRSAPARAAAAS